MGQEMEGVAELNEHRNAGHGGVANAEQGSRHHHVSEFYGDIIRHRRRYRAPLCVSVADIGISASFMDSGQREIRTKDKNSWKSCRRPVSLPQGPRDA